VVQVEGFAFEDPFPLRDGDVTGGSGGNLDLVPASWNVLEVGSQAFAGLDATRGQREEGSTVGFVPVSFRFFLGLSGSSESPACDLSTELSAIEA